MLIKKSDFQRFYVLLGYSKMPATATNLKYSEIVDVDVAPQVVNFADAEDYGHRVQIAMGVAALNGFLGWTRASGSDRPVGAAIAGGEAAFKTALELGLNTEHADIDGVTGGLHFSSSVLSTNTDARIRAAGVSANDIPLAFVLYKLYGSSTAETANVIYNLADAHGMVTSAAVAEAISTSFLAESVAVDMMFRDLLSADPARFFDASGNQLPGLFEVSTDVSGEGSFGIVPDDIIEVKLKMTFTNQVSRRGAGGREHDLTGATEGLENEQVVIAPNDYFYIRLQMVVV
jgi:hypothetical protein